MFFLSLLVCFVHINGPNQGPERVGFLPQTTRLSGAVPSTFTPNYFRPEQCSMECHEELLERLPQLIEEENAALYQELTLEELTAAISLLTFSSTSGITLDPI